MFVGAWVHLCRFSPLCLPNSQKTYFNEPITVAHHQVQGCNHSWKVEGDQGLGPIKGRPECWVREGVALSRSEGLGCHLQKIFENSDAKSCILMTLAVKFLAFWKLRPRSWGTNTLLVPQPKSRGEVGGPVSPGPYGCCAYDQVHMKLMTWSRSRFQRSRSRVQRSLSGSGSHRNTVKSRTPEPLKGYETKLTQIVATLGPRTD